MLNGIYLLSKNSPTPLFLTDNINMDRIATKIKCKIVLIPDSSNSVSKFYLQIADKKLMALVFPLFFHEARASGSFCSANSVAGTTCSGRKKSNICYPVRFLSWGSGHCVFKTVISTIN